MDYREIYKTLNDDQLKVLGAMIDRALRLKNLDEMPVKDAVCLVVYPYIDKEIGLNTDQLTLFCDIARYIIFRRDHIKELIYETMRKEFFAAMDLLMSKQKEEEEETNA